MSAGDAPAEKVESKMGNLITLDHKHHADRTDTFGYSGPVKTRHPNPAAYGGRCAVEVCKCGARRPTNINGDHREVGPWSGGPRRQPAAYTSDTDSDGPVQARLDPEYRG